MHKWTTELLVVGLASVLTFGVLAAEKEERLASLDKLPPEVKKSVIKMTKGAKIEEIEREREKGKTVYEIEASCKGVEFELVFAVDGTLVDFEIEDDEDDDDREDGKDEEDAEKGRSSRQSAPSVRPVGLWEVGISNFCTDAK